MCVFLLATNLTLVQGICFILPENTQKLLEVGGQIDYRETFAYYNQHFIKIFGLGVIKRKTKILFEKKNEPMRREDIKQTWLFVYLEVFGVHKDINAYSV